MFYLRFIGTVHFHKSWNAPTAKYSCPQLHAYMHHNYYARYPLRALSQLYSPPRITCSQQHTVLYSIHLSTFHCRTCLFEKDLQSLVFRQIWRYDSIIDIVFGISFLPLPFFFFWTKIHMEKSHGSHTVCLLSGTRVSNTIFFSYVQSAKYKSWPTASHHDLECINSELPSFVQVPTIGKSIFNRWITLRSCVHSAF